MATVSNPPWTVRTVRLTLCAFLLFGVCRPNGLVTNGGGTILECPMLCRCLEKGSIITCRHAGLNRLPNLLSTTMFLDFDHNHVSTLRNGTFANAPRIEMLNLQDNEIQTIESGTLSTLTELHTLLLGRNLLSSLPVDLFVKTLRLEILDLRDNIFAVIPDVVLAPLHSLRVFNLSYNYLESPHLGPGFSSTKQLRVLDLSGNNFISLEPKAFRVLRSWSNDIPHALNLSRCNIHHIHRQTLRNLLHLDSLSLAGNPAISSKELNASIQDLSNSRLHRISLSGLNISDIYQFFRNFQHPGLQVLYLSRNIIQNIRRGTFYHLIQIRELDLSHNKVRSMEGLSTLTQLKTLHLSHNELHYLDPIWLESFHNLESLDLSNNALTQMDEEPFQNLFYLQQLDISSNKISRLTIMGGLESLNVLLAQDNILSDLSFVSRLRQLKYLDVSHNVVMQIGPNILPRGQHFLMVNFSGNAIYELDPNAFQGSTQVTVDLSFNRLASLAHAGWSHIQRLFLDHNMLYNVTANSFTGLVSLRDLYLGHNQLMAFSRATFQDLASLRTLDLHDNPLGMFLAVRDTPKVIGLSGLNRLENLNLANIDLHQVSPALLANLTSLRRIDLSRNQIRTIKRDAFAHLRHLQGINLANNQIANVNPELFYQLKSLHYLDLSYNPLHCTCSLMPFRTWAISTLSQETDVTLVNLHDTNSYQCVAPPEWKAVPLINFHLDSTSCSTQERMVLFAAIACILLALALTVVVAVLRYKWWRRRKDSRRTTIQEYTFVDDSSTAALTGNQTLSLNSATQTIKEWV